MAAIGSKGPSATGLIGDGSGCWDTESYQELQVGEVEVEGDLTTSRGLDDKVVRSKRHMLIGGKCAENDHRERSSSR
jgi:hypothetical protein